MTFSQGLTHDTIGDGWSVWSHGYTGDVYDTGAATDSLSVGLTLPNNTTAFVLYAEPNSFADYTITATAQDGTTLSESVNGNGGATGFGFYTDGSSRITSVTVKGTDSAGLAIGEFKAAAVPEPVLTGTAVGVGAFGLAAFRRLGRKSALATN